MSNFYEPIIEPILDYDDIKNSIKYSMEKSMQNALLDSTNYSKFTGPIQSFAPKVDLLAGKETKRIRLETDLILKGVMTLPTPHTNLLPLYNVLNFEEFRNHLQNGIEKTTPTTFVRHSNILRIWRRYSVDRYVLDCYMCEISRSLINCLTLTRTYTHSGKHRYFTYKNIDLVYAEFKTPISFEKAIQCPFNENLYSFDGKTNTFVKTEIVLSDKPSNMTCIGFVALKSALSVG